MPRKIIAVLMIPAAVSAAEIPIADFARDPEITHLTISPDGKYLAEARLMDGHDYLVVQRLSDHKITAKLDIGKDWRLGSYAWVGSERIVLSFAEPDGFQNRPRLTGELVSMSADMSAGESMRYVYGFRGGDVTGSRIPRSGSDADFRDAEFIEPMPGDPHSAIIAVNDFPRSARIRNGELKRVNVYSGTSASLNIGPIQGYTRFLVDSKGMPRYAVAVDEHWRARTFSRSGDDGEWTPLNAGDLRESRIIPFAISSDDKRVFVESDDGSDRLCIVEQEFGTATHKRLSCDDAADVTDTVMSFDGKEPIAAVYEGNPPWERLLDTDNLDRQRLHELQKVFPNQLIVPVSHTDDGKKVVLHVYSDRNPGDYYLFDAAAMKADYMGSARSWIDPDQMSERRAIEFKARDGQSIHGIITLPKGHEPQNLPLVVYPHGGPFGTLDTWAWDADAQLLASRGYAVLQVNFRGSGGYGESFLNAGRQRWDSIMIDDITDGTQWAIKQGFAKPGRICIYGGSYGGYAAMMSAVREPDLYRCVIGYAGIYDLNRWKRDTDISSNGNGRNFIAEFVSNTPERLKQASPITLIDKLKADVMIVHGEEDERVPVNQANLLREALESRHLHYEWLVKPNEGHGFFGEKNRQDMYEKMLAFLERNIGSESAGAADSKPPDPPTVGAGESSKQSPK